MLGLDNVAEKAAAGLLRAAAPGRCCENPGEVGGPWRKHYRECWTRPMRMISVGQDQAGGPRRLQRRRRWQFAWWVRGLERPPLRRGGWTQPDEYARLFGTRAWSCSGVGSMAISNGGEHWSLACSGADLAPAAVGLLTRGFWPRTRSPTVMAA